MRRFLIQLSMKRFIDYISDVAVVVASSVGVGLISGKETQVFVGNTANAVIFFVVFCLINAIFREFCRKNACNTPSSVACVCFSKGHELFGIALCACSFVCLVTCLAGVEQCLGSICSVSRFPLYSLAVAALSCIIMLNGMRALKIVGFVSVALTVALFAAIGSVKTVAAGFSQPRPFMPIVYAFFNFTMSCAVACKLGSQSTRLQNFICSAVSALILSSLLVVTNLLGDFSSPLPMLSALTSPFMLCFASAVIALAAVCGIVGCAFPVVEQINAVMGDKVISAIAVFGFALAFSLFGFDFLVKFGYILVAFVGVVMITTILLRSKNAFPSK